MDEIIEEISRDLGVAVQARSWVWRRRTPQDIATLRARAAAPLRQVEGTPADPAPD